MDPLNDHELTVADMADAPGQYRKIVLRFLEGRCTPAEEHFMLTHHSPNSLVQAIAIANPLPDVQIAVDTNIKT